jgi:hypothetical protein
MQVPNRERD